MRALLPLYWNVLVDQFIRPKEIFFPVFFRKKFTFEDGEMIFGLFFIDVLFRFRSSSV